MLTKSINPLLIFCIIIAFLITYIFTYYWIPKAKKVKLVGYDMNKKEKYEVAELGGISVVAGIVFSILLYIAINVFIFKNKNHLLEIFAILTSLLIATIIGIIDDILGWKIGLKQWQKPLLTLAAAIPLMVINAGVHTINLPLIGTVHLGIIYPLILIPIGVVGVINSFNMVAGYNGLEAGMGIIILFFLSLGAYLTGKPWLTVIGIIAIASLLAFLIFNKYPAKVFPGDTLTYSIGSLIASMIILGNLEKLGLVLWIPYFIDAYLVLIKGKKDLGYTPEAFAKVDEKGYLKPPYKKPYHLTHLVLILLNKITKRVTENIVVLTILAFEFILGVIYFLFYF